LTWPVRPHFAARMLAKESQSWRNVHESGRSWIDWLVEFRGRETSKCWDLSISKNVFAEKCKVWMPLRFFSARRRKFKSLTSDNMESWKTEQKSSQQMISTEEKSSQKKEDTRARKSHQKGDALARNVRKVAKCCVSNDSCVGMVEK